MMVEFRDIVEELELWTTGRGVLVHGAEGTFCSGADLNLVRAIFNPLDASRMSTFMQNSLTRFHQLPLISVALLEGWTLGGGAELATACDFMLMSESAKLAFVQGRMGVVPGWGGGVRLTGLVGRRAALDLLTTSKVLSSKEALDVGLVNRVVSDGEGITEAGESWLKERIKADVTVVRALKAVVVNAYDEHRMAEVLARERDLFTSVWARTPHLKAMEDNIKHK